MRTMSERIEAAAEHLREYVRDCLFFGNGHEETRILLAAAFPELFADPPTAWLAPVEPDERMKRLGAAAMWGCRGVTGYDEAAKIYSDMRDAFEAGN